MINTIHIKKHILDLKNISHPSEIYSYFKTNNLRQYAYSFLHLGTVLKHGESASHGRDRDFGERVRRQAENIDGWSRDYRSTSGKDMQEICEDFLQEQSMHVLKDDVTIVIYDFSDHVVDGWRKLEEEIKIFEAEMIARHKTIYGYLPIGNLREESSHLRKTGGDESRRDLFDW